MPDNIPALEIPGQPTPTVPDSALERADPPNLSSDLEILRVEDRVDEVREDIDEIKEKVYRDREKEAEVQTKEHALQELRVMFDERKRYSSWLFNLSAYWLMFIGAFLLFAGAEKIKVADSVLIALITTTTANVLGLFYIVARWLFPNKNTSDKDGTNKMD